ncbi:MAG: patatin-like phospholipase family protein [Clostridiales bacterium]
MDIKNTGLVLEGGGMRGVYTSGILHFLMEKELWFPYVIGVSMGACNAANYISRQIERNKIVNIKYVNDSRYISYLRIFTSGELFGMNFIFNTLPNLLEPFDFRTFWENDTKCITTVTDCIIGEAVYYEKNELGNDYMRVLQASCSLPFISKPVEYDNRTFLDGGISDSIPVWKSIKDGNKKNVIILTQPKGYRKKPESLIKFAQKKYSHFPGLVKALNNRHNQYNETVDYVEHLQENNEAFILRPLNPLSSGRIETNKNKLYQMYDQGYKDASDNYSALCKFLES